MIFYVALYGSLILFLVGSLFRIRNWFRIRIGEKDGVVSSRQRIRAAARNLGATVFSRRILSVFHACFFDVMLQARLLREGVLRWLAHLFIFYGFLFLLLMHALDGQVTRPLFPGYESTLNPYLFLRNLFGFMVLVGVLLAVYRRIRFRKGRLFNLAMDRYALSILAIILLSGFLLESTKILSASLFNEMVDEYAPMADKADVEQLKRLWAHDYAVVFPDLNDKEALESMDRGRELHEESCAGCHARPRGAFVSFSLARLVCPFASLLERTHARIWLWYLHVFTCFAGLAYLPFSKFFHIFSTPVNLLANKVRVSDTDDPAHRLNRRALALDACMHCGTCSQHCSVGPVFSRLPNPNILPAEKLLSTRAMARGKMFEFNALQALSEGSIVCTGCSRCTTVCPAGIDLQDLWISSRSELAEWGFPEPHVWVREANTAEWAERVKGLKSSLLPEKGGPLEKRNLSDRIETFYACVQCQTCTNVCPVVACSENPEDDLEMTPQQIMNLLRLGLKDHALGSRMVWDCVTCYMCQEHCPEGIRVADILYELRNMAYGKFRLARMLGKARQIPVTVENKGESKEIL